MRHYLLIYLSVLPFFTLGQNIKDELEDYVWDLSSLYENSAQWQEEKEEIESEILYFKSYVPRVSSKDDFISILDRAISLKIKVGKMSVYGYLLSSVDIVDKDALNKSRVANLLETKVDEVTSFLPSLILSIRKDDLASWVKDPKLDIHNRLINEVLKNEDHILVDEAASMERSLKRWEQSSHVGYSELNDSQIDLYKLNDSTTLNLYNYRSLFSIEEEDRRKKALSGFYSSLKEFENVYAHFLTSRIESNHHQAINQNYENGIDLAFSRIEGYSSKVYQTINETINGNLDVFHDLFELMLEYSESANPSFSDLFFSRSKFNTSTRIEINESIDIATSVLENMGEDYIERLRFRINDDRLHLALTPNKSPGAFATYPGVGGNKSFLVLPYYETFTTSSALTGGLALLMAYTDMPKERPFIHRYDPPIYSNALIYAGRVLHDDYLIANASTLKEKENMIMNSLFNTFRAFFNYSVINELQYEIQNHVSNNHVPNGNEISNIYMSLMNKYYGEVMQIPDYYRLNWITFSQIFATYDSMFWPPSYAAGIFMAEGLRNRDKKAINLFSGVLGNKITDQTYDLFNGSGLDLESKTTYKKVIERIKKQVAEIKEIKEK